MAFLEKFSDDEKKLLASLPYRAGYWVSQADAEGGDYAEVKERAALEQIIRRKAEGMFESAFVHEVMVEAFEHKDEWEQWGSDIDTVPEECRKAVTLIAEKLSPGEVEAFRQNIMVICTQVARAFREFDEKIALPVRIWTKIKIGLDKVIGLITRQEYISEELLNISYEEDVALSRLAEALRAGIEDTSGDVAAGADSDAAE